MNNPSVFIGAPLKFKDNIQIYPPTVKDVVTNPHFSQFLKILTISQEDIEDELQKKEGTKDFPTPFEFLFINCFNNWQFKKIAEQAFEFFLHTEVSFLFEEKILIIGKMENALNDISKGRLVVITEDEYFDFQNAIRTVCGESPVSRPVPVDPDEDPRIAAIKAKARARDRIKAKQSGKGGISLQTCLIAICCMGIGLTPLNIGEMSYAAVGPIMKMSQEKEKYDIDIRSLLAGADSKKIKPKYWIWNTNKD